MKLLHVTATHLNPEGGIPVVLKNLVEAQNSIRGLTSRVVSLMMPVTMMGSVYFDFVRQDNFNEYIKSYMPDFVIIHSFFYIEYNQIVDVLQEYKIKYYIEPHGAFGKAAMNNSWLKKKVAINTIFRKQIKNAFGIIFLCEAERNDSCYRTDNDIVIPNGIDPKKIEKCGIKKEPVLYYIGRYDVNHKGLDYLLSALYEVDRCCQNIRFKMWGKGKRRDEQRIEMLIKKLKNIDVEFSTPLLGGDKDYVLEQLGPMVLTSRYEGMPMTILEAWMYGNPCLVTEGTNMSKEIEDNNLGWVVDLESESIAKGIEKAYKDYCANREVYIKRCKEYVEKYSWDNIAKISFHQLNSRY